jgi:hypothetical protein
MENIHSIIVSIIIPFIVVGAVILILLIGFERGIFIKLSDKNRMLTPYFVITCLTSFICLMLRAFGTQEDFLAIVIFDTLSIIAILSGIITIVIVMKLKRRLKET